MIQYFLEVTIAWTLFYSIYLLFLRKETFFNVNRWYLLNTIWIGALLPFLRKLPVHFESAESIILEPVTYINYGTQLIAESVTTSVESQSLDYNSLLGIVYFMGVLFFGIKMYFGLKRILNIYRKGEKRNFGNIKLIVSKDFHLPFSFLDKVFIHESFLGNPSIKEILDHESTHVNSHHTYDVLFIEVLSIIFWWNPMIYLYRRSLRQVHEYVADAYASAQTHIKNYGHILLGHSSSGIELALTNQFFNAHLKKRITMLYKKKSAKYQLSRYLLVIPLFLFLCVLYSFKSEGSLLSQDVTTSEVETQEVDSGSFDLSLFESRDSSVDLIPQELKDDLDHLLTEDKYAMRGPDSFMKGVGLIPDFKRLIAKYPNHEDYIDGEIERRGLLYGKDIVIYHDDEDNYGVSSSPIKILRLVVLHDSDVLEVGKRYTFKALHPDIEGEKLSIDFEPSIGHLISDLSNNKKDNLYSFAYSPDRPTKEGEKFVVTVKLGEETARMKFTVVGEAKKEKRTEGKPEKSELITLHNGEVVDLGEDAHIIVDGHIEHITGVQEIEEKFGMSVDANTSIMNIVGAYRFVEPKVRDTIPQSSTKVLIKDSNLSKDCPDLIFILDGEKVEEIEHVESKDIKEINVYKKDFPNEYQQYSNECGMIEVITKKSKKKRKAKKERKSIEIKGNVEGKVEKKDLTLRMGRVVDGKVEDYDIKKIKRKKDARTYGILKKKLDLKVEGTEKYDYLSYEFKKEGQALEKKMPMSLTILGNPVTNGEVVFEYRSDYNDEITVHISDMNGRPVAHQKFDCSTGIVKDKLTLKSDAAGMYSLTVFQDGLQTYGKFVVQ